MFIPHFWRCAWGLMSVSLGVLVVGCESANPAPPAATKPSATSIDRIDRPPSMRIYGVTLDDISGLNDTLEALNRFYYRPTTSVVFDLAMPASHYREVTKALGNVSYVMGEILDSQFVRDMPLQQYVNRTRDYLDTLGNTVDIWEVGNEVNGDWLGQPNDVSAKVTAAFDLVKARQRKTALTLYYTTGCGASSNSDMLTWANTYLPTRVKENLDYVFVSYYEDDCHGKRPHWPPVFQQLGQIFPQAHLGFGEIGTTDTKRKAEQIRYYYGLHIPHPRFVGGYFWWYFKRDMVPPSPYSLWSTLNQAFKAMP